MDRKNPIFLTLNDDFWYAHSFFFFFFTMQEEHSKGEVGTLATPEKATGVRHGPYNINGILGLMSVFLKIVID